MGRRTSVSTTLRGSMRFDKQKVQGIMGTEVRYSCSAVLPGWDRFEVVATSEGVFFTGRSPNLSDLMDLQDFAKIVGDASAEYIALKKCKIVTPPSLGGH